MKKIDAVKLFGHRQKDLAAALSKSVSAISQWPDDLTVDQEHMVLGAAYKLGKFKQDLKPDRRNHRRRRGRRSRRGSRDRRVDDKGCDAAPLASSDR